MIKRDFYSKIPALLGLRQDLLLVAMFPEMENAHSTDITLNIIIINLFPILPHTASSCHLRSDYKSFKATIHDATL